MTKLNIDWTDEPDLERLREAYHGLKNHNAHAVEELEALANSGSLASACYLGEFYLGNVLNNAIDLDRAQNWFSVAEKGNVKDASYRLGIIHTRQHNLTDAFNAFSRSAAIGYLPGMYRLADYYRNGEIVPKNLGKYEFLLKRAWKGGHIFAKRDLAGAYVVGKFGNKKILFGVAMLISLWYDLFIFSIKWFSKSKKPDSQTYIC